MKKKPGDLRRDAHSDSAGRDIVTDAAAAVSLGDFLSALLDEGDNGIDLLGGDSLFGHDLTNLSNLGPELFHWIASGGQGAHRGDDHGATAAAQAAHGGDDHDAASAWGGKQGQGTHHGGGGHGGDG